MLTDEYQVEADEGSKERPHLSQQLRNERAFIEALANVNYLHHLAQNRHLDQPAFAQTLRYLHYWKQPRYARHIRYPQCLAFLELLDDADFRAALKRADYADFLCQQQHAAWRGRATELRAEHLRLEALLSETVPDTSG